tara:strand:- start:555 stop:1121 length:567 start_codon:yes stop_codon:yes gene_type:complete
MHTKKRLFILFCSLPLLSFNTIAQDNMFQYKKEQNDLENQRHPEVEYMQQGFSPEQEEILKNLIKETLKEALNQPTGEKEYQGEGAAELQQITAVNYEGAKIVGSTKKYYLIQEASGNHVFVLKNEYKPKRDITIGEKIKDIKDSVSVDNINKSFEEGVESRYGNQRPDVDERLQPKEPVAKIDKENK